MGFGVRGQQNRPLVPLFADVSEDTEPSPVLGATTVAMATESHCHCEHRRCAAIRTPGRTDSLQSEIAQNDKFFCGRLITAPTGFVVALRMEKGGERRAVPRQCG